MTDLVEAYISYVSKCWGNGGGPKAFIWLYLAGLHLLLIILSASQVYQLSGYSEEVAMHWRYSKLYNHLGKYFIAQQITQQL